MHQYNNVMKILSLSIAAYNVEKYIDSTLKSLVPLKANDAYEVIIVDDGSKDNTSEIAKKYCEAYPNVFKLIRKENGGYGSTINYALQIAVGKYFKLLDGDDWIKDDIMDSYLDYLSSIDSDIVLSPYDIVYMPERKEKYVDNHNEVKRHSDIIENIDLGKSIVHQELAVKTSILKNNDVKISENCFYTDQEFVFESIFYAKTISKFENTVYCYRMGREGQSVSIEGMRKHYNDAMIVAKKIYPLYENNVEDIYGGKKQALETKILGVSSTLYKAYMTRLDRKKSKKEIGEFDREIKYNYPNVYRTSNQLKRVNILRKLKFVGYEILCRF